MSQPATEATPRPPARSGGNPLTRKYGPLPGWGWVVLGGVAGGVFLWWRSRSAANNASAATAGTADTTGAAGTGEQDFSGEISVLQAEIQQLQGENSTPGTPTGTSGDDDDGGGVPISRKGGGGTGPPTRKPGPGGGSGPGPIGTPGGEKGRYRHVSTGSETLTQIARKRSISVGELVALSQFSGKEDASNLSKLKAWARAPGSKRKGVVYYTERP